MRRPPKMDELLSYMTLQGRGLASFYNRRDGEYKTFPVDAFDQLQRGIDPDALPVADRLSIAEAKRILDDPDYIRLPTPIQINEHRIRLLFCESLDAEEDRVVLERTLRGRLDDQRFKMKLYDLQLEEAWNVFQDRMYRRVLQNWCHLHDLEFES